MKAKNERSYPYLMGIICSALYLLVLARFQNACLIKSILPEAINISAISMGFLATAKAILFSINDRKVVIQLQDARRFTDVIDYLVAGIRWSFALAILSMLYRLFDLPIDCVLWNFIAEPTVAIDAFWIFLWVFVAATMLACFYRVTSVFAAILRRN